MWTHHYGLQLALPMLALLACGRTGLHIDADGGLTGADAADASPQKPRGTARASRPPRKMIVAELWRRHGDGYEPPLLSTLQRRMHEWRALHGPEKEVMFQQKPEAGREGSFDFTDAPELGVTIIGRA